MRHRRLRFPLALVVAFAVHGPVLTSGEEVFVRGAQDGRGFLRARGSDCYAVTPRHVVDNSPVPIQVIGGSSRTTGQLHRSFPGDVAAVRLAPGVALDCSWQPGDAAAVLTGATAGVLRLREEDGSITQIPVNLRNIEIEFITINVVDSRDTLMQAMSGGLLIVQGHPVGMLLSVHPQTRQGTVYRTDAIQRIIQALFDTPKSGWPKITVEPFVELGRQDPPTVVGNTRRNAVTVANAGDAELTVTEVTIGDESFVLQFDGRQGTCPPQPFKLRRGTRCSILVDFTPRTADSKTTTLRIVSDDVDNWVWSVMVHGRALSYEGVAFQPTECLRTSQTMYCVVNATVMREDDLRLNFRGDRRVRLSFHGGNTPGPLKSYATDDAGGRYSVEVGEYGVDLHGKPGETSFSDMDIGVEVGVVTKGIVFRVNGVRADAREVTLTVHVFKGFSGLFGTSFNVKLPIRKAGG